MKKRFFNTKKRNGFTLIETLLAVTVLVMSITGPLTIASKSLNSAVFAKSEVTAFYLAQEAIEYARNVRDTNALLARTSADPTSPQYWLSGLASCIGASCTVEAANTTPSQAITPCSGTCAPLLYHAPTGFYGYQNGSPSQFTRSFSLEKINDNEYAVTASISWSSTLFGNQFVVRENILKWQ